MSAQTKYTFDTPFAGAGGIYDLSPYAIDGMVNEEDDGVMGFGLAVIAGTAPGKQIKLPTTSSDLEDFEGITVNGHNTEWGLNGELYIRKTAAIGVMRYGRILVKVVEDEEPEYNDPAYFSIASGTFGEFQTTATNGVAINGRFLGGVNNGVAPVELYRVDLTVDRD